MNLNSFYRNLLAADPPPIQILLEQSKAHGFFNTEPKSKLFLATLVVGLYATFDRETRVFHDTLFVIPKPLEAFCLDTTNKIVQGIRESRAKMPKAKRISGGKLIVEAFNHLHMGSRVLSLTVEPPRWVAFGFGMSDAMPDWMRKGLVDPNG